jgi:hypothetical protein
MTSTQQWLTINSKIDTLRNRAPISIMIDIKARKNRVIAGQESVRSFNRFLTTEINRFRTAGVA